MEEKIKKEPSGRGLVWTRPLEVEDIIAVLENIQARTHQYERIFPYMSKEYCEILAQIEGRAIDEAILMLRNPEKRSRVAHGDIHDHTSE